MSSNGPSKMSSKKMGFLAIAAVVVGSQVGVGILGLPGLLASFGSIGLMGWIASGGGAILLSLIFAQLASHIPRAGGPHVYVQEAFGKDVAFFIGWGYWLIAWTSNIVVIIIAVRYLTPVVGELSPINNLALEIAIVCLLTLVNIFGPAFAGRVELGLTALKCFPLIIIPIGGILYFNLDHFEPVNTKALPIYDVMKQTALLTFWGFIGLESATANSGVVENPRSTIPKSVILGTIIVASLYILNSVGVMSLVSQDTLITSKSPYVDAAKKIFGDNIDFVSSLIISLACIGTLNAWILTAGQIAYGAARDGLFPKFYAKTNRYGAPYASLLVSLLGTILLLCTTLNEDLGEQIFNMIDVSVTAFLFVYLSCMMAFLKLYGRVHKVYGFISLLGGAFCLWVILNSPCMNIIVSLSLVLSGLPVYLWHKRK